MSDWTIGIIGGSGLYAIDALEDAQWIPPNPPGVPRPTRYSAARSAMSACGSATARSRSPARPLDARCARQYRRAQARRLHRYPRDQRSRVVVGRFAPGRFVTVDQFIDNTKGRPASFFGDGFVAHVSMADPVCDRPSKHAAKAVPASGGDCTEGATYLAMEGPQFSTAPKAGCTATGAQRRSA